MLADPRFQATFGYSVLVALATIVLGVLLVVPTAYWVELKLRKLRPVVEFITLLPLVIPPIVLVFGYLHIYNSSSLLPLTGPRRSTDLLLTLGYVTLALPYMYRAVDTGLRAIDVRTADGSGRKPRGGLADDHVQGDLPECAGGDPVGRFLTFAIVIGEFRWRAFSIGRPSAPTCSSSAPTAPMSPRPSPSSPSSSPGAAWG